MTTTAQDVSCYDLEDSAQRRIVVGVDTTDASLGALRWAVEAARRTGAVIDAVRVYRPEPDRSSGYGPYPAVTPQPLGQARRQALDELRLAVATALAPRHDVEVELIAVPATSSAKVLMRCARGASMLVIGECKRRGLRRLRGRSVSSGLRYAPCPLVVVPVGGSVGESEIEPVEERVPTLV